MDIEQLIKDIGATSQEDLTAKLKLAYEKGSSIETIEGLSATISSNAEITSKALAKLLEDKDQQAEEAKYNEMAKSKLFETYTALPDNDPQKTQIREEFEKRLGISDAGVLLDADAFVKELQAPISKANPKFEDTREFRKAFDFLMFYAAAKDGITSHKLKPEAVVIDPAVLKHGAKLLKQQGMFGGEALEKAINVAMDSITSTEGLEWIPAQILSRNLYQDVWLNFEVAGNFSRYAAAGPTFAVPIRTSRSRLYTMSEATAVADYFAKKATASSAGTDKVTFTIQKAGVLNFASDELVDDSAVAILEEIYGDIAYGAADGIEDAVINGSHNASLNDLDNQGTDTNRLWNNTADAGDGIRLNTGAVDARFLWDGIRKAAIANGGVSVASASFTRGELLTLRAKMKKYGVNPADVFLVVSPATYIKMLAFPEVATLEKYGAQATVLKGELARLDNIPIIVSPRVYENLDTKGVFTNSTVIGGSGGVANLTEVLLVHKRGYAFADRMSMRVESDRQMLSGQRAILGTMRLDFRKMFKSTEQTEAVLYNVVV